MRISRNRPRLQWYAYAAAVLTAGALAPATALAPSVALAPAAAAISTRWTIEPGGAYTATTSKLTLKDLTTGSVAICALTIKGTLKSGSGLAGAGAGSVTSVSFTNCTGPLGVTFSATAADLPWPLNLISVANGGITATLSGIHIAVLGPACSLTIDGTGATAHNGGAGATYTNSTGVLSLHAAGSNMRLYQVNGCAGLANTGDKEAFTGNLKVTPKQAISAS